MTDPIHTAARALFERVGWLYQAGDPKCTEEGVRAIRDAILAEREQCAKVAENSWEFEIDVLTKMLASNIAAAIRKGD